MAVADRHSVSDGLLLVEQNATKALEIADYSYVLSTGKIVSSGEGRSLLTDASVRSAYLG